MKYRVAIERSLLAVVVVEAENMEQAEAQALQNVREEDFDRGDLEIVEVEEVGTFSHHKCQTVDKLTPAFQVTRPELVRMINGGQLLNLQALIQGTDFQLLRNQKTALLSAIDGLPADADLLQGLVHLIDAFQDAVVDDGLVPSKNVFLE